MFGLCHLGVLDGFRHFSGIFTVPVSVEEKEKP